MISFPKLDEPVHLTYLLICCTTISIIIFEYKKQARLFKKGALRRITGPVQIPLLGNLYQLVKTGRNMRIQKYLDLYFGFAHLGITRIWVFNRLLIFLCTPKYVEAIVGNVKSAKKPPEYKVVSDSALGGGLISQPDVDIWRTHRKIITPTFHFNVLKTYIPVFHEETMILIEKLETTFSKGKQPTKIIVPDIKPLLHLNSFDSILRNVFGVNIQAQNYDSHSFLNATTEANDIIQQRMVKCYLLNDFIFRISGLESRQKEINKICHDFTETVIHTKRMEYERKQQLLSGNTTHLNNDENEIKNSKSHFGGSCEIIDRKLENNLNYTKKYHNTDPKQAMNKYVDDECHKSFLELIIENEANEVEKMTDEDIRDNMITLMFAGQETTATTNCFTMLMLALHPEIQRETLEEIDSIFGGPGEDDGHVPTHSEIMQLHTLDRVIKETMRLYPAAPCFARSVLQDTTVGPYILPKGSTAFILVIALHRDPNLHPKAHEFWPDRFLPHNSGLIKNYSYLPFAAGPRNCLGQKYAMLQMKVVMSTILRKYRVSTDESIKCLRDIDNMIDLAVALTLDRCPAVLTSRCSHVQ